MVGKLFASVDAAKAAEFKPQELANTMLAFAKLGIHPPDGLVTTVAGGVQLEVLEMLYGQPRQDWLKIDAPAGGATAVAQ